MSKETREARKLERQARKQGTLGSEPTFADEFIDKCDPKKIGAVAGLSVLIYLGELALDIVKGS